MPPTASGTRNSTRSSEAVRLVVWSDRLRVDFVREVLEAGAGEITLIGVAAPDAAQSASLADVLGAATVADLRRDLDADGVDLLWLAADAELAPDTHRWVRQSGRAVVTSEPQPAMLDDLDEPIATGLDDLLSWRSSPSWIAATDLLAQFGPPDAVNIVVAATQAHGSLLARLVDAADLVEWLCSPVETVSASLRGVGAGAGVDSVRGIDGHLTAHLRCGDGRTATIAASSASGGWTRDITLLSAAGRLRIDERGFEWIGPDGTTLDTHACRPADAEILASSHTPAGTRASEREVIARHAATRLISMARARAVASGAPTGPRLAIAHAALLSCRTGHSESCHRMARILGGA